MSKVYCRETVGHRRGGWRAYEGLWACSDGGGGGPGETGAVAWRVVGRRKARGLPEATEVGLILGCCEGGSFGNAQMRGLPAEGTWRDLCAHGASAACLRRFETV
jgi:hypothetical protein